MRHVLSWGPVVAALTPAGLPLYAKVGLVLWVVTNMGIEATRVILDYRLRRLVLEKAASEKVAAAVIGLHPMARRRR
jgi:hypothetical protein